ncbi:transcription intermediary factor 1-alpha-like isoform X1 [Clytia hemisphaerica]|uniref:Uncharacterized protein n=1 Tax=Clytia hemisphaerica TaxID=252671 RepID=A0A7M5WJD5_9CNID
MADADTDQVFLDSDHNEKVTPNQDTESGAKQVESNTELNGVNQETIDVNLKSTTKPDSNPTKIKQEDHSNTSTCKYDEDDKLIQSESGTLLSRGGEFEAEPNQPDSVLNDIQTNSDIRFFICGSCKYNPILIGSVPKLLPCLHSFCEQCLQKRYEIQKLNSNDPSSVAPRLKCPSCGQEFLVSGNDKPTSAFLNNQFVIESTPNKVKGVKGIKEDHPCTSCDDDSSASSYCMNCNEWLCDACVSAHQRVKVTKDHIIQSKSCADESGNAESPHGESAETKHKPLFCKIHPQEQLKLFCANCEKLTCRDCQLIEHKDHRYQFIDEAATRHREILKKLLQYLQINLGLLKDTISDVEKVSDGLSIQEKELEREINNAFNTLIVSIKARQDALLKELNTIVSNKKVLLNKQKKDLTQMKVILEHNHDFAEFAVKGGSNVALLYSRKVLGTRLHNLNSLKYRQRPLAALDLKFNLDVEKLQNYFSKVGSIFSHEEVQRKNDSYANTKNTTNLQSTMNRQLAQNINRNLQSGVKTAESLNFLKRQMEASATNQPPTKYINLAASKQGLAGHQMVRTAAMNNSPSNQQRYSSPSSSAQDMIVLTSPHSSRSSYYSMQDGKVRQHVSKYGSYQSSRDHQNHIRDRTDRNPNYGRESKHISPKTPSDNNRNFQFYGGARGNSSLSSPIEHQNVHWPKISNEQSLKDKVNIDDVLQKGNEQTKQLMRKLIENSTLTTSRSPSTKSNGSDGSSHPPSTEGNVVVKQEQVSDDSQSYTAINGKHRSQPLTHHRSEGKSERSESGFDEGQNEDYCGVCRNGGELLCCDTCPKVYHLHCHIPSLHALPSDSWSCYLCKDIGKENSSNLGTKRKHIEGMTDWENKLCRKILLNLFVHSDSLPFHHKVSKAQAPDYYKVITRPMDLNTILTKLSPNHFENFQMLASFISDIRLVFSNCFVYNSAESEVCKMGRRLEGFFDQLLRKYVPHELHYPDESGKLKQIRREDTGVF